MNQTRSNRKITSFFILCLIALTALTGCKKPTPTPEQTGGGYGRPGTIDLVDSTNAYGQYSQNAGSGGTAIDGNGFGADNNMGNGTWGEGEDGLTGRSDNLGGAGNQLEGLLPSVYFGFDQFAVRPEDRPNLQAAAEFLAANAKDRLLLEGHCDSRGTAQYNLALGERRANAVFQYLTALGVNASRIEVLSKGDVEATTNGSESDMAHDRRVDLIVLR